MKKLIPLENQIITNEDGGRKFIRSRKVETPRIKKKTVLPNNLEKVKQHRKEKKKVQGTHYMQTTVVNPCTCQQKKQPQPNAQTRGNQINWNNQFAQRNGVSLNNIFKPKPCYICGRTNHLAKQCYFNPINQRIHSQSKYHKSIRIGMLWLTRI